MNKAPIDILADIVTTELELNPNRVWIFNQGFNIPTDNNLFGVIEFLNSKPVGVSKSYAYDVNNVDGSIIINTIENYRIQLASVNTDAMTRIYEVPIAMNSYYATEQQGKYQFRIAQISSAILNLSRLEATRMLNRFAVDISVFAWYKKTKTVPYYDTFDREEVIEY